MSLATDMSRHTSETPESPSGSRQSGDVELDLERLVWDPEYRAAMQPLLRHDA